MLRGDMMRVFWSHISGVVVGKWNMHCALVANSATLAL